MSPSIDDHDEADRISRRSTLVRAGGLAAAAIDARERTCRSARERPGRSAAAACVLSPEMTDGPYYLPRREGAPEHHAKACRARRWHCASASCDAATCKPIKGAAVDIWHASAGGKYSGEEANDTVGLTFLRGIQRTDAQGPGALPDASTRAGTPAAPSTST